MSEDKKDWERDLVIKLAESSLREQKTKRRWGIFFKLVTLGYLITLLVVFIKPDMTDTNISSSHTALINLEGLIADNEISSADNIVTSLRNAFKDKNTVGVILRINSPGGTPVQAGYIYDEIIRLRDKYPKKPLYAVISDVCASGGYYVAAAAEKIYADKASIVGSIGVRMDNFGFVDAMQKIGVERRTLTAGKNKALMDPFLPIDEENTQHMSAMLDDIHQQFINAVKNGRGDRLKQDADGLFTGLIWTGAQSLELGLVDELASSSYVAREVIGAEKIVEFTVTEDLFERLADRVGANMVRLLNQQSSTPWLF